MKSNMKDPSLPRSVVHKAKEFELKYNREGALDPHALTRSFGGFTRSQEMWPAPMPGSTPSRFWFFAQQEKFRFGGCPEHANRALMPKVCHDVDMWKGTVRLWCSGVLDTNPSGWRKCLVSFPYPMSEYKKLPQHVREDYESLETSLLRGASVR